MTTNEIDFHGVSDILTLTVGSDLPEMINAFAEISHDGKVWQRVQTTGLNRIFEAGQYVFRVNHGVLIGLRDKPRRSGRGRIAWAVKLPLVFSAESVAARCTAARSR